MCVCGTEWAARFYISVPHRIGEMPCDPIRSTILAPAISIVLMGKKSCLLVGACIAPCHLPHCLELLQLESSALSGVGELWLLLAY